MRLSDERIAKIAAEEFLAGHGTLNFARAIEREAYRSGQEAMRERAAREAAFSDELTGDHIRALEIEEPK